MYNMAIMNSLRLFQTKPFINALRAFFEELQVPINAFADEPATPQDILGDAYKPDNDAHLLMGDVYVVGVVNDAIFHNNRTVENLAALKQQPDDYDGLLLLGITLKHRADGLLPSRSQLAEIARTCNRAFKGMPVTVVFLYSDDDTTLLSFANVERTRYKQEWREGEKVGRVTILRDIRTHETHQGHIRILRQLAEVSASNFNQLYNAWKEVFDLSTLNKQFYKELANWYFWAKTQTRFSENDTDTERSEALIRLVTRVVFCWFLREKGLIPRDVFKPGILESLLNTDDAHNDPSRYYKAVLQNLFFGTLNQDMTERRFRTDKTYHGSNNDFNQNHLYRYKRFIADEGQFLNLFKNVPFLNGGLFECLDDKDNSVFIDRFTDREDNPLHIPDHIFFGDTATVDLNAAYGDRSHNREEVRGLFRIFDRYVFTVAENTPLEEEVALDPELLGRIFENLLAAYNPETGETARKATGSFYTPREVVSYMVAESLTAHVAERLLQKSTAVLAVGSSQPAMFGNEFRAGQMQMETPLEEPLWTDTREALEEHLRRLFDFSDAQPFTHEAHKIAIIEALSSVRILDPACGSGAFPMGILQTIVHALRKLDPDNQRWKAQQRERLIGDKIREIEQNRTIAAALSIEEVRKQAVSALDAEFERLTADFDRQNHDYARKLYLIQNCIYGVDIQPIAVQIAKLRFFISLVIEQDDDPAKPNRGITPLPNLEVKFVAANALIGLQGQQSLRTKEIDDLEAKLVAVRMEYFTATNRKRKKQLEADDNALSEQLARELQTLGTLNTAAAQMISRWNPYKPTQSAPFFDAEWMFGIKDGFDVVIGNPPYVRQELIRAQKPALEAQYANVYAGTADLLVYFYGLAERALATNGVFALITSNKFMRAGYGAKLRAFLKRSFTLRSLIDFGDLPVFEALAYPCIVIAEKTPQADNTEHTFRAFTIRTDDDLAHFAEVFRANAHTTSQRSLDAAAWRVESASVESLMQKLKAAGMPLGDYVGGKFFRGITTGFNDAFVITTKQKDALIAEDPKSAEVIKPFLRGRDVKRYEIVNPGLWLIFARRGIDIEQYPAIKRHLEQFREGLEPKPHGWVGEWAGRKTGTYKWFELQDAVDYYAEFEKEKIILGRFMNEASFAFDKQGYFHNDALYMISEATEYVVAVLNSSVSWWFLRQICTDLQNGYLQAYRENLFQIPIPAANAKQKAFVERWVEKVLAAKAAGEPTRQLEAGINILVYKLYALTYEEVLVIEPDFRLSAAEYAGVEV